MSNWFLISLGLLVIIVLCFYGSKLKPIKEGWNPKSPSARVQHDIDLGDKINPKTNKPFWDVSKNALALLVSCVGDDPFYKYKEDGSLTTTPYPCDNDEPICGGCGGGLGQVKPYNTLPNKQPFPGATFGTAQNNKDWCPKDASGIITQPCWSRNNNCPKGFLHLNKATYDAWHRDMGGDNPGGKGPQFAFQGDCVQITGDISNNWLNYKCDPYTKRDTGKSSIGIMCYPARMSGGGGYHGNDTYRAGSWLNFPEPKYPSDVGGRICASNLSCKKNGEPTCVDSNKVEKGVTKYFNTNDGQIVQCVNWTNPRCPFKDQTKCPTIAETGGKCVYNKETQRFFATGGSPDDMVNGGPKCTSNFTKYNCDAAADDGGPGCTWVPNKSGTPDSGYDTKGYACKKQPGSVACGGPLWNSPSLTKSCLLDLDCNSDLCDTKPCCLYCDGATQGAIPGVKTKAKCGVGIYASLYKYKWCPGKSSSKPSSKSSKSSSKPSSKPSKSSSKPSKSSSKPSKSSSKPSKSSSKSSCQSDLNCNSDLCDTKPCCLYCDSAIQGAISGVKTKEKCGVGRYADDYKYKWCPKPTPSPKSTPKATHVAKSAASAKSTVPKHVITKMASALPHTHKSTMECRHILQ